MPYEAITEKMYDISATATGGREGRTISEDGVVDLPLGKPGSKSNPKANPETLFAAGYAACYNGALNLMAKNEGLDTSASETTAKVTLGKTDTGVGLAVELVTRIPGVDEAKAQELAEKAHEFCPYSKATRGNIEVTVKGVPA